MNVASSIIAKNAIEDELFKLKRRLEDVEMNIRCCESTLNDPWRQTTSNYDNQCRDKLISLYPQRKQLQSQIESLRNSLNSIQY